MLRRLASGATSLIYEQKTAFYASQYCRGLKGSTGIVGIEVDPEARQTFTEKCRAVIDLVGQHIPQEAAYRRTVENTYRHRLKTSESEMADEEVEEAFSAQLEQLTKMADEELALIPLMAGRRNSQRCTSRFNSLMKVNVGCLMHGSSLMVFFTEWKPWDVPEGHKVRCPPPCC